MIHPDVIDALVAAGATAAMIAAAIRADWNAETRETVSPVSSSAAAPSSTARVRAFRARKKVKRETVSPVSPPLSQVDLFPTESEEGKGCGEGKPAQQPETPSPIPPDWKPDLATWQWVIGKLGEGAALRCLANFIDHSMANAKPMTEAQRRAKLHIWVRNERSRAAEPQPQFPLLAVVPAAPAGKIRLSPETHAAQWRAWAVYRGGKSLPLGRDGAWWVDSEWPPGHDPPMRATG